MQLRAEHHQSRLNPNELCPVSQCSNAAKYKLTCVCRQRHQTADNLQRYADVMCGYYTALREGAGSAEPEHSRAVEKARRDQQVRDRHSPFAQFALARPDAPSTLCPDPKLESALPATPTIPAGQRECLRPG